MWVDGEDVFLDSFMNWYSSEPSGGTQMVVRLQHGVEQTGWKWFDGLSPTRRNYICKRQLAPSTDIPVIPTPTHATSLVTDITDSTSGSCPRRSCGDICDCSNDGKWVKQRHQSVLGTDADLSLCK